MNFILGHRVRTPTGHEGTIVDFAESEIGAIFYKVAIRFGTGTGWYEPVELIEIPLDKWFEEGDEVTLTYEDDIETIGTILNPNPGSNYSIRWSRKYGCTHEHADNLRLYRRAPTGKVKPREPKFQAGTRVYFVETNQKFPLGIVEYVNFIGVLNFDGNDHYNLDVLWDNGVKSRHDICEIGRVEDALKALSLPIP